MWFDKLKFHKSTNEILDDIESGYIKSAAWLWLASGAIAGFLVSCIKLKRKTGRPVIGKFHSLKNNKTEEGRF